MPPDRYTEVDLAFIVSRVLELTYTAFDLKPWAEALGYTDEPFPFDPMRRTQLRAELDAYFARLYGLTLFHELMSIERASIGLTLLAGEIEAGRLKPEIAVEAGWAEIGTIAQRLIDRDFTGKAVLHIN